MTDMTSTKNKESKRLRSSAGFTILKGNSLTKAIAKDCGYHLYEIEDILASLVRVSTNALLKGEGVRLLHLCTLVPWANSSRRYKDINTKEMKTSISTKTIKVV